MMMMRKDTGTQPSLYLPACIGRVDHRDVETSDEKDDDDDEDDDEDNDDDDDR